MSDDVDVIVLGMGPGGEVAASRLLAAGRKVAVVERELIGGECAYWGCIPSKTLLRPPDARAEAARAAGLSTPALQWPGLRDYRDYMIRHLDDTKQVQGYANQGATVIKAAGRITGRTSQGRLKVEADVRRPDSARRRPARRRTARPGRRHTHAAAGPSPAPRRHRRQRVGERPPRAGGLPAPPSPLVPHQPHRRVPVLGVPRVAHRVALHRGGEHPARRARPRLVRRDQVHNPRPLLLELDPPDRQSLIPSNSVASPSAALWTCRRCVP